MHHGSQPNLKGITILISLLSLTSWSFGSATRVKIFQIAIIHMVMEVHKGCLSWCVACIGNSEENKQAAVNINQLTSKQT